MNHSNYLITKETNTYQAIQDSAGDEKIILHNGSSMESFSQLVNTCVEKCATEIIIMMSHRVRPTKQHFHKLLKLLDDGYAFVGLYRLAFFGFRKQLMRQIGVFDERYLGGGYEDDDFYLRIREADLAFYLSHEVPYNKGQSTWDEQGRERCRQHFVRKWGPDVMSDNTAIRKMSEQETNYNLGPNISYNWLSSAHSKAPARCVRRYLSTTITKS